jgi:P27 family predicted phage terminase small subunit
MAIGGARPKPTVLKILEGNPGKRPLPTNEPVIPPGDLSPPSILRDEALAEWHRVVGLLVSVGIATPVDRAVLAAYCNAWGRFVDAERMIQQKGMTVGTGDGYAIQSTWLVIANKALDQLLKLGTEFGMTPSSRCRLTVAAPSKPDDFAMFLGGKPPRADD